MEVNSGQAEGKGAPAGTGQGAAAQEGFDGADIQDVCSFPSVRTLPSTWLG
jgi:hypothetical protein